MQDNSESFRNELIYKLLESMPQDQVRSVLSVLDSTINDYDISRKPVSIIPVTGIPDIVKYFLASKAVGNLSQSTLRIYQLRLIDFFNHIKKPFQDVRPHDIRSYLYYYQTERNASDAYRDNIRRILSTFFKWLTANEYLLRNPCANIERIKYQEAERIPLTSYELEELRWNCKTIREKALVDFLYSTGMRAGECCAVNKADIDWQNRSVVIRRGKGKKRRIVYFNAESELTLRKYLETRDDDNAALFVSMRRPHNRLGVRAIENEITKISARCETHSYPHRLRHTFATSGLHSGMPLHKLQALMGHAEPRTTLIYAKLDQTDLQLEHSRIYT